MFSTYIQVNYANEKYMIEIELKMPGNLAVSK